VPRRCSVGNSALCSDHNLPCVVPVCGLPSLVAVALRVIAVPEFEVRSIIARDVQSLSVSCQVLTAASM
jgi:hypothetical protein